MTVDLEDWFHAVVPMRDWHLCDPRIEAVTNWILLMLSEFKVTALFYVLGVVGEEHPGLIEGIRELGHSVGSHGYAHGRNERAGDESDRAARKILGFCLDYRSPYWDTTPMPGMSGGFFFRALPINRVISNIEKSGIFWIHPHDVDPFTPKVPGKLRNWKRHLNIDESRQRFCEVLQRIKFSDPMLGITCSESLS